MKNASTTLYKETLSESLQVSVKNLYRSMAFGMIPKDVLGMDISFAAKVVFAAVRMMSKGESVVALSCQSIADVCHASRPTVIGALRVLEKSALIRKSGAAVKQVQPYEILHERMLKLGRTGELTEVTTARKKTSLVKCVRPGCKKLTPGHSTGWCIACRRDVELDGRIRRKVEVALDQRMAK